MSKFKLFNYFEYIQNKTICPGKEDKSSDKCKKDKDEKRLDDEFDKYWAIKKAIDAVDKALNKLAKDKENLYGYELIDALHKENRLLEQ